MRKAIFGLIGLGFVSLGVGVEYGWPWAAIVAGAVIYFDTLIASVKQ